MKKNNFYYHLLEFINISTIIYYMFNIQRPHESVVLLVPSLGAAFCVMSYIFYIKDHFKHAKFKKNFKTKDFNKDPHKKVIFWLTIMALFVNIINIILFALYSEISIMSGVFLFIILICVNSIVMNYIKSTMIFFILVNLLFSIYFILIITCDNCNIFMGIFLLFIFVGIVWMILYNNFKHRNNMYIQNLNESNVTEF